MCLDELRPTTDAIYDITIAFSGESPLKERAPGLLGFFVFVFYEAIYFLKLTSHISSLTKKIHQSFSCLKRNSMVM